MFNKTENRNNAATAAATVYINTAPPPNERDRQPASYGWANALVVLAFAALAIGAIVAIGVALYFGLAAVFDLAGALITGLFDIVFGAGRLFGAGLVAVAAHGWQAATVIGVAIIGLGLLAAGPELVELANAIHARRCEAASRVRVVEQAPQTQNILVVIADRAQAEQYIAGLLPEQTGEVIDLTSIKQGEKIYVNR